MSSEGLHEPREKLLSQTIDFHRAVVSMKEELEALDWYQQRVDAAEDEELKRILAHHRDEEKEHFVMLLEWLRRRDPVLSGFLKTYLFTDADITTLEALEEQGGPSREAEIPSVGSLKEESSDKISGS
ncbi:MAG: ferritin [Acidobacteria bacterium]|nr:ferritin [Acidobacteriota bacterium]